MARLSKATLTTEQIVKAKLALEASVVPGFPKQRPRQYLCFLCGLRTADRAEFDAHIKQAHP